MGTDALLLSSGRKGTFLLLTPLGCHPDIFAHDQVFSGEHPFVQGLNGEQAFRACYCRERLTIPADLAIILPVNPEMRNPEFWAAAVSNPQLHIIHLHRRNMLAWFLSLKVAQRVRNWVAHYPVLDAPPPVTIDPAAAVSSIDADLAATKRAEEFFCAHPSMHVDYEELVADFGNTVGQVQEFIGVGRSRLRPQTYKQMTRQLRDVIVNYDELCAVWSGSRYEKYLYID